LRGADLRGFGSERLNLSVADEMKSPGSISRVGRFYISALLSHFPKLSESLELSES
jgi:hypothetical protein